MGSLHRDGRQPRAEVEPPAPEDMYAVGVLGVVARMIRVPDGTLRVLVQGGQRVRIERLDRHRALSGR